MTNSAATVRERTSPPGMRWNPLLTLEHGYITSGADARGSGADRRRAIRALTNSPDQSSHCFRSASFIGTYSSVRYVSRLLIIASTSILKPLAIILRISFSHGFFPANHG